MAKVILVLAKHPAGLHPMLHSGLLVSLTRVQNQNGIRILCIKGKGLMKLRVVYGMKRKYWKHGTFYLRKKKQITKKGTKKGPA
eukprot:10672947-Ditylum_brightwellii.AAC.2